MKAKNISIVTVDMWLGNIDIRKVMDIACSYLIFGEIFIVRATFFKIDLERIYRVTESGE